MVDNKFPKGVDGGFKDTQDLINRSVEMANGLRNAAEAQRASLDERQNSPVWTDNVILQGFMLGLSFQILDMIRRTYEPSKIPSDEEMKKLNLEIQTKLGQLIQNFLTDNIGCDGVVLGQKISYEGEPE